MSTPEELELLKNVLGGGSKSVGIGQRAIHEGGSPARGNSPSLSRVSKGDLERLSGHLSQPHSPVLGGARDIVGRCCSKKLLDAARKYYVSLGDVEMVSYMDAGIQPDGDVDGSEPMCTVVHLSDLHFHATHNEKQELLIAKVLQMFPSLLVARRCPVVALVSGDIVENGREAEFDCARKQMQVLENAGFTVLCCPGNHDTGLKGNFVNPKYMDVFTKYLGRWIVGPFPNVTRVGGVNFIGIDSMQGQTGLTGDTLPDLVLADGQIGPTQLRKLDALLEASSADPVICYLHHHPWKFTVEAHLFAFAFGLEDGEKVRKLFQSRATAVLFGHEHEHARLYWYEKKENIPLIHCSPNNHEARSFCTIDVYGKRQVHITDHKY